MNKAPLRPIARPAALLALGAATALGSVSCQSPARTERAASAPAPAAGSAGAPRQGGGAPLAQVNRSAARERAIQILLDMALSPEPQWRANALEGLLPAPSRLEPVARAALHDENIGVRYAACIVIGRAKLKDSAPMVEPLRHDPDPRVQSAALYALSRAGREPNLTPLARALQSPDFRVKSEAVRILGDVGHRSAAPMIRAAAANALSGDPIETRLFRLQAAEALVKLGETEATDSIRAALFPASRDDYEAAVLAAQILGELKDQRSIRDLIRVVEETPAGSSGAAGARGPYTQPRELRMAAASALGKLGYGDGVYVGEQYASDPDPLVRQQAALVFGDAGSARDLPRLTAMMDDPDAGVRLAAAAATLKLTERRP